MKLDRARKHLDDINIALQRFQESNAQAVNRDLENDGAKHVYRVQGLGELPDSLSLLIGDVLHNGRSALDHLVYGLSRKALPELTKGQERKISYPISDTPEAFEKYGGNGIAHIPARAQTEIENLQPFNLGPYQAKALWALHRLNILDKHRELVVGVVAPHGASFMVPDPEPKERYSNLLHEGAVVAEYTFPEPHPEMNVGFSPDYTAAFSEAEFRNHRVWDLLNQSLVVVEQRIIPALEPFFP